MIFQNYPHLPCLLALKVIIVSVYHAFLNMKWVYKKDEMQPIKEYIKNLKQQLQIIFNQQIYMDINQSFLVDQDDVWIHLLQQNKKKSTDIPQTFSKQPSSLDQKIEKSNQIYQKNEFSLSLSKKDSGIILQTNQKSIDTQNIKSTKIQPKKDYVKDLIFKQKIVRLQGKKNSNVPKFFVRIFLKYFQNVNELEDYPELLKHFKKVSQKLKTRKTNNYNISDLLELIQNNDKSFQIFNRKAMIQILQKERFSQILKNGYISSNQKTYLMASKIYSIRCRSRILKKRTQYR